MDEARRVLERLDRIEGLRRTAAPPGTLLAEVQALLSEAEEWVRVDPGAGGAAPALERMRVAVSDGERFAKRTLVA
jgi:hypothetical protein